MRVALFLILHATPRGSQFRQPSNDWNAADQDIPHQCTRITWNWTKHQHLRLPSKQVHCIPLGIPNKYSSVDIIGAHLPFRPHSPLGPHYLSTSSVRTKIEAPKRPQKHQIRQTQSQTTRHQTREKQRRTRWPLASGRMKPRPRFSDTSTIHPLRPGVRSAAGRSEVKVLGHHYTIEKIGTQVPWKV